MKDVVIIGAGLTGLTIAFLLQKKGFKVTVLEKKDRTGGAIRTHCEDGYVFEEGPNTGVVSNPEVVELFEMLGCRIEEASTSAEKRLILKNGQWHPLPHEALPFIKTPLFSLKDKLALPFEPFRKRGTDPDESVAALAARRIGQSFADYAVNPFISGIYAGDPEKLVTRHALPKLYNLEQKYGSFIGGSFKKSREKKSERDRKASRKVFSVEGGLGNLINYLSENIGAENIICNAGDIVVTRLQENYRIDFANPDKQESFTTGLVISTIGAYGIQKLLPFIPHSLSDKITNLNYAKIIQVAAGLKENVLDPRFISFGGLIPQKENHDILGVLFPSYCFNGRTPQDCALLAIYMGGIIRPELFGMDDNQIELIIIRELKELLGINKNGIRFLHIFRHEYAIPQYEKSSGDRFEAIQRVEDENPGLILAGNLRNGIGMADRIKQAFEITENVAEYLGKHLSFKK